MKLKLYFSIAIVAGLLTLAFQSQAALVLGKGTFPTMCPGGGYVTQVNDIYFSEGNTNDLQGTASTSNYFILSAPTGYEFRPGFGDIEDYPAGTNSDYDDNVFIEVYPTYVYIRMAMDATQMNADDSIVIFGLQMRALAGTAGPGSVTRTSGDLNMTPTNVGVSHADLTVYTFGAVTVAGQNRCGAGNITFSPSATGASTYNLYDQATGGTLLTSGATLTVGLSATTTYYVSAVHASGCESLAARTSVVGTVNGVPSVTSSPSNQPVCQGATAIFTVGATGAGLTYQWQENTGSGFSNITNGGVYSGATSATLTLTNVTTGMNNYFYQCIVSGTCTPSATSSSASLFVTPAAAITTHPSNVSTCVNAATSGISVVATGTSIAYQWQVDQTGAGSYSDISNSAVYNNVTASTLTVTPTAGMNGYRYRCRISATCSPDIFSNASILTVNSPISVSTQPTNQSICEGQFATLSVVATGTNLGYSWYRKPDAGVFAVMSDAGYYFGTSTSTLYIVGPDDSESNSEFYCIITGGCGNINSSTVTLTVNGLPTVTGQPSSVSRCVGGNATFTITANNASGYQWQVNTGSAWSNLSNDATYSNVTTNSMTVTNASLAMHLYAYRCIVSGSCTPPATSNQASLSITQASPDFTGLNSQYCSNGDSTQLIGTPSGGTFSGSGVYNAGAGVYWFNPRNAGVPGNKNITYTYTLSGCSFPKVRSTTIIDKPTVNFTGLAPGYSETSTSVPLNATGTPSGGGFSFGGIAVTGTTFNPTVAGIGTHTLYAYYIDLNNCKDTVSASVQVVPQSGSIIGLESSYCRNSPNDTIYGVKGANGIAGSGDFDIGGFATIVQYLGDSAIVIDFNNFGTGSISIRYSFVADQCFPSGCNTGFSTYANSFVTEPPSASFNSRVFFCHSDPAYTLVGSPSGGVFTGTGVTYLAGVYRFNPSSFPPATSGPQFISYSYVNSTNGCRSMPDPLVDYMYLNPTPAAPILDTLSAGTPKRIHYYCQGETRIAWRMQASPSTFYWYSDAAFTSLVAIGNTFFPLASTSIVDTVSYFVRGYNGSCFGPSTEVVMVVNQKAFANAGSDKVICEGTNSINISTGTSYSGSATSATWARSGGGGTFPLGTSYGGTRTYAPDASDVLATQVYLVLSTNDPDGAGATGPCLVERDTVLIRINPRALVNAGTNQLVCESEGTVLISSGISIAGGTQSGVWTREGGGGTFPDGISYSHDIQNQIRYTLSAADILANGVNLILTTVDPDGAGPCSSEDDTVRVNINGKATILIGSNQVICAGATQALSTANLTATIGGTASNFTWSGGGGVFSVTSGTGPGANTVYTPALAELNGASIDFTLVTNDPDGVGPCLAASSLVNVVINQRAFANAGNDTTICAGINPTSSVISLTANVSGSATSFVWSGGLGSFLPPNGLAPNASTDYTPGSVELTNATPFKLYLSTNDPDGAGPCQVVKDSMVVTINRRAIVNAGLDKVICEGTPSVNLTPGSSITGGTTSGTWSKVGAVGTFTPANTYSSSTARSYVPVIDDTTAGVFIVLTSSDPDGAGSPCQAVTDTLFIQVNKAPFVNAGPDQTVCAGATGAQTPVDLSAAVLTGSSSSATWSGASGSFAPSSLIIAGTPGGAIYYPDVTELTGGIFTLRLVTNDPDGSGPCVAAKDSMELTINPRAVVSAGLDRTVCENTGNVIIFPGTTISGGTTLGYWERSGGGGTFVADSVYSSGTRYQLDASDILAGNVTLVLVSEDPDLTGPCQVQTDTMSITIRYLPLVDAGADITVCAGDSTTTTLIFMNDASVSVEGSPLNGNWSGGAGTFSPNSATINNVRYIPVPTELISGTPITLTLTSADPQGPCGAQSDTKLITINPRVFVDAGSDQSICTSGPQVTLSGNVVRSLAASSGVWSAVNGNFDDPAVMNTVYHVDPVNIPPVGANAVTVTLTLTGLDPDGVGPCTAESDSMQVTVYSLPSIQILGLAPDYCQKPGTVVTVNGTPNGGAAGSGFYLDPLAANTSLGGATSAGLTFLPTAHSAGLHTLRYQYINPSTTCSNYMDVVVSLKSYPFPAFIVRDSCAKRVVNIDDVTPALATGGGMFKDFLWEFGENGNSSLFTVQTDPTYTYNNPNNYNIKLTVQTDSGCTNTVSKLISIGSIPTTDFRWSGVCPSDVTSFYDMSGYNTANVRDYFWNFTGLADSIRGTGAAFQNPQFDYSTVGTYNVTFTITSDHQCDSSITKAVNILPYAAPTSSSPYVEDFNTTNGSWAVSGKNPSWQYGTPSGKQNITHNNNVWITKLANVYNVDEKSYLDGPCFNFSNLTRPMVAMKVWSATQQQIAGATVEASGDGGTTWERIGAVGEGINWYDYPNVIGNPGNQSIAQGAHAWTGQYGAWRVAKIGLPTYSGNPNVRLRVAFGSGLDSLGLADGFALDSIHVGEKTKLVLLEHFTNANGGATAQDANAKIDLIRSNRPDDVAVIDYHTSFPSPDPYSTYNYSDPGARVLYYGVSAVPRSVMDGNQYSGNVYAGGTDASRLDEKDIDARSLESAIFEISLNSLVAPGKVTVGARVRYKDASVLPHGVSLQLAVVEDSASGNDYMNSVLRKLLPDAVGTPISVWGADSTVSIYQSYTHSLPNTARLGLVAFVQDLVTKEIYQSTYIRGSGLVGNDFVDGILDAHMSQWDLQIYPNPASDRALVLLGGGANQKLTWSLMDELGQIVDNGTLAYGSEGFEINTSKQTSGIYLLRLEDEIGGMLTRKIVVTQ